MTDDTLPEPDRVPGAPHPRETLHLIGQAAAAATFLDAFNAGRMHHAWLISGPRGIGKATLAWGVARFLLATPEATSGALFGDAPDTPTTLDIPADHPVARRIAALSEPRLFLLRRRPNDRETALSQVIRVEDVRDLIQFLHLSAADGGRRVVIVDTVDEMNTQAANALLKLLEEPPAKVTFLLISHQPSSLLPTIRSRCRDLRLGLLPPDDLSRALTRADVTLTPGLTELAAGSVGEAVRLALLDGPEIYARIVALMSTLPDIDRPRAIAFADSAAQRGAEAKVDLIFTLTETFIARLATRGASGHALPDAAPGEAALLARLSPTMHKGRAWADLHQSLSERIRHGRAVNLDPSSLLLDMVLKIAETAGRNA